MTDPHAVVTCGEHRRLLRPGQSLTFGRGRDVDLRIGHLPEDRTIPRHVGRIECRDDGVLLHSTSARRGLRVQTFPGPGFTIDPLGVGGSHPHARIRVSVAEAAPDQAITIVAVGLGATVTAEPLPEDGATVGFDRIPLAERHRRLLTALCLPPMTRAGQRAAVPTYAGIQEILAEHGHEVAVATIRNGLFEIRTVLTNQYGVGGLQGGGDNFLRPLALWAMRSGNVTDADLDALDDHR